MISFTVSLDGHGAAVKFLLQSVWSDKLFFFFFVVRQTLSGISTHGKLVDVTGDFWTCVNLCLKDIQHRDTISRTFMDPL